MNKSNFRIIFLNLVVLTSILAPNINAQAIDQIDQYAAYISERFGIPGMSIGVIKDGALIHRGYYGTYDLESKTDVDKHSLFNLHSLSKVFVNTAVFKLIEEGKIDLEDKVNQYIKDFPKHWEAAQVKHLLSHSSGMPNIIRYFDDDLITTKKNLYAAPPVFKPGAAFDYNQTNFWILNRIIDQLSDDGFDDAIRKQIRGSVSHPLMFDSELVNGQEQPKEYRPSAGDSLRMEYSEVMHYMNGAGGINITLDDFINWNLQLDNNELISAVSKQDMWRPFQFANDMEFAHGWGIYNSNGTSSVGFSGGGVAGLRKFIKQDLTVIVLTNGYQYGFDVNSFINWIAGTVRPELTDDVASVSIAMYDLFSNGDKRDALSKFELLKNKISSQKLDDTLNSIGYELLAKKLNNKALTVFELNTAEHPDSWNAWDSLAEGYELTGSPKKAIKHYKQSLELNPNNEHAMDRLSHLEK